MRRFIPVFIGLALSACSSKEKQVVKTVLDIAAAVCPETDTVRQCAARIMNAVPEKGPADAGVQ